MLGRKQTKLYDVIQNAGKAPWLYSASDSAIREDCPERMVFELRTDYQEKSRIQSSEGKTVGHSVNAKSLSQEQIGVFG